MRVGDFVVEVVPYGSGHVRELDTGHVLARPGQVYCLRLRNMGPLYCVANVSIDESGVTANGLVLAPWSTTELERPINAGEHGRFTVVAEGNEAVFGPDGGRDNPALGLIEATFRRELPGSRNGEGGSPLDGFSRLPRLGLSSSRFDRPASPRPQYTPPSVSAIVSPSRITRDFPGGVREAEDSIERAAGTGLTGYSDQRFVPFQLGPLEAEPTTIRLRLVIGTEAAIAEAAVRPLADVREPARPAARP
jgi:hypothetical protein